jgi:fatty-acyl-CoA synthase
MSIALEQADTRLELRNWTVGDLLADAVARAPESIALKLHDVESGEVRRWSYAELQAQSWQLANALAQRFRPGEHVAIWAANGPQFVLIQLAAAQAGLVLVTLNPALRAREAGPLLAQSRAVGLFQDRAYRGADLAGIVRALRPELQDLREVFYTDALDALIETGAPGRPQVAVAPADPALLLYTSGTTGAPKGVVLHHRGIVNNAIMGAMRYGLPLGVNWLGVLPMFHVGGSVTSTLGCISRLSTNVIMPAFEPAKCLKLLEAEKIAWFPLVPAMVLAILECPEFAATDLSALQIVLTGATTITPEFVRLTREKFKVEVQVMFGQTESGGGMTKTFRGDSAEVISATVGRPYPHTEMRIAEPLTGVTVARGEIGEIRVRSPFMMAGYFENPSATQTAFDGEGYLRTGDLGALDEAGYLHITGRLKEMIIRGGENIYPREVEDALAECAGVVETAVVGVPHEKWGEEVAVAVRCEPGKSLDVEAMREFLQERIARHKVPKLWKIVPDFPRTASGKIQKFEVSQWFK